MKRIGLDRFGREIACKYRGESYRVRDNGAVRRLQRANKRRRPLDEVWTFGRPCKSKGYMNVSSTPVHRIVATAFHGDQPSSAHVVDHVDTNRRNNRPENLRWVTRLENLLLNPITARRIEAAYGSLELFWENPQCPLEGKLSSDFEWMRTVTKREARASKDRLLAWAKEEGMPADGKLGEWVFRAEPLVEAQAEPDEQLVQSKTRQAVQRKWRVPAKFPNCPVDTSEDALANYCDKLKQNTVFAIAPHGKSTVVEAAMSEANDALIVHCKHDENSVKDWSVARVTIEECVFVHESKGTFFTIEGAQKVFTLSRGLQWDGGDTFDDFC